MIRWIRRKRLLAASLLVALGLFAWVGWIHHLLAREGTSRRQTIDMLAGVGGTVTAWETPFMTLVGFEIWPRREYGGASVIHFKHAHFNDPAVQSVRAALESNENLVRLFVADCRGTNKLLKHVAVARGIKVLEIRSCDLTDAALPLISKVESLRAVILEDTEVTEAGVKALHDEHPDWCIRWRSKGQPRLELGPICNEFLCENPK